MAFDKIRRMHLTGRQAGWDRFRNSDDGLALFSDDLSLFPVWKPFAEGERLYPNFVFTVPLHPPWRQTQRPGNTPLACVSTFLSHVSDTTGSQPTADSGLWTCIRHPETSANFVFPKWEAFMTAQTFLNVELKAPGLKAHIYRQDVKLVYP